MKEQKKATKIMDDPWLKYKMKTITRKCLLVGNKKKIQE